MSRFDIYQMASGQRVVEVQADTHVNLATTLVIPLLEYGRIPSKERISPTVQLGELKYIILTPNMAAVPRKTLGKAVGNIGHHRQQIVDAIDFLLQGY